MTDLQKKWNEITAKIEEQSIQIKELQARQQEIEASNVLCDALLLFVKSMELQADFDLFLEDLAEDTFECIDSH